MARDRSFRFDVPITVVRDGGADEKRLDMKAAIWQETISLPVDADVEVGDVIGRKLPNGKMQSYLVTAVNVLQSPFYSGGSMDFTEVKFTVFEDEPARSTGSLIGVPLGIFKKIDLRYLASALAEGVTQDQIDHFELGLSIHTEGSKIKRASAIAQHIFDGDDPDGMFLNMLDFIYVENPRADQAFSSQEYKLLAQNVLGPRKIQLGDSGYYIASEAGATTSDLKSSGVPTPRPSEPDPRPARPDLTPKTIPIGGTITVSNSAAPKTIFIVHGHDMPTVNDVRIEVNDLTGIMPEILADSAGRGDTIIEKFERRAAESDYAIVVLTPDDEGRAKGSSSDELKARARQNVILELGYFYAKLGRTKVAVIHHGVELPSDINGVNYIRYGTTTWLKELRAELGAAGFELKK
ncbi:TIR domain-containing protein [Arthrobacter sp. ISL-65]|uniref:TIR domain-containing protein n=1 Tax=Arthrobacter sp. ISL-65 TaxID=2819112 RepID=UPI001BE88D26|nr:nucleotide-binding protein [Arthrobacter sp. ISL-65]MBT2548939.1 nucleotide-binding protein [Arthrobacter sp. ISL-65]